jgi:sulfide dehydrogenase cytochrome subunit
MKMRNVRLAVVSVVLLGPFAVATAQDLSAITETCNGCHGENGVSEWSDMPTIAGIDSFTHSEALYVYRDGARPCGDSEFRRGDTSRPATNMCEVTADLADEQIEEIAEHYANLPFVPAPQDFDAALAARGETIHSAECDRCHSDGGSNVDDEASILAGQWMGYLETAFAQYASGEREQPKQMKEKLDPLSDDDIKALLHYYASQQ